MAGARRGTLALALVGPASSLLAAGSPALGAARTSDVTIQNFTYSPAALRVQAGDTVRWANRDSAPHTATARDGSWDTSSIEQGGSATVLFERPGTYAYTCRFHASMAGSVVVDEAPAAGPGGQASTTATTATTSTTGTKMAAPANPAGPTGATTTTTTGPPTTAAPPAPAGAPETVAGPGEAALPAAPHVRTAADDGDDEVSVAGPGVLAALLLAGTAAAADRARRRALR